MIKSLISILIILVTINSLYSQENKVKELELKKEDLLKQINVLQDSVKIVESLITLEKSKEIRLMLTDSSFRATARSNAKLKKNPNVFGELITTLTQDTEVVILDYKDGYFGVCADSVCGYMSDAWINKDQKITAFIKVKEAEERELKRLEEEQRLKEQKAVEMGYIKKYGQKTYDKLKQGYYWTGMTREMATISLGSPSDKNRTVGSWGVHEQWVYGNNLYLYFENGKLTSWQD